MIRTLLTICTVLMMTMISGSIHAEEKLPLEITADQALEWNQTDKHYVARGSAMAKQGELSVAADLLKAEYAGKNNSTSDLTRITAEGHVLMTSQTDTATGEKAVYDLLAETLDMSGGRPKITKGKDTLEADHIRIFLENGGLARAEATGKVIISTSGQQKATGDKATYNKASDTAELIGNARLMQGENWLEGDRAQMNLTTKISTITGGDKAQKVKGVFYPSVKKGK